MPLQPQGTPEKRTRRRHKNSRKGCLDCKRRRIRCDEEHPRCQNCIKYGAVCSYPHPPTHGELLLRASQGTTPRKPRLPWSAKARAEVRHWRRMGSMPIAVARSIITLQPTIYSDDDLCCLYLAASNQHRLGIMGVSKLTVLTSYLPSFFPIIPMSRLAMNGVLALSAYQVASVTNSDYAGLKSIRYQTLAIQELRECLPNLQPEHVDAALVTSLALLWLSEDMSSRGRTAAGISAILRACGGPDRQSEFCHMIAHAWSQTVNMPTTPDPGCRNTSGLQKIIDKMWKFAKVLGDHKPDDDTRRQLNLLIALAEDMVKVGPIASTDKHSEWFQLLRYYKLSLPFKDLLTDKDLSSILMVNAYLHAVALYSPPQLTQPYLIDLRVDLPSLLDETLRQVRSRETYVGLLSKLKAIVLSV